MATKLSVMKRFGAAWDGMLRALSFRPKSVQIWPIFEVFMMRHFFDINAITAMMVVCLTDSTGERTVSQPDKGLELVELTFEVF